MEVHQARGSITRNADICGPDFYETPTEAIEKLYDRILSGRNFRVLEPASGGGRISKFLEKKGFTVTSSDIRSGGDVYGSGGVDFLSSNPTCSNEFDAVITNPPYKLAMEFIRHSFKFAPMTCMLLRLSFLESSKRKSFFESTPLSNVLVFSKRIKMWDARGEKPKNGGMVAYAWFVWEKGYNGHASIGWI